MPLHIKLSTNAMNDPKVIAAGPAATILWLRGLAYAKEHMTDGEVSDRVLPILAAGLGNPKKLAAALVANDLWEPCAGGHTVGAERWARHQTTRDEVEEKRERWRKIKANQRGQSTECPRGQVVDKGADNRRGPAPPEPEHRAQSQSQSQSAEGGKPPSPPRGVLSQDADRPDMAAPVREAMRALERWSARDRGSGLDAVHGEFHTAEDRCTNGWQGDTPIIHAGEPVNPVSLVPLAVERIMGKPNPPAFRSVKFALGCVNAELADMRARGTKAAPDRNTIPPPAHDYAAILGEPSP